MNSFKGIAYQILKEAGKSLHSKKITKIALDRGLLQTIPEYKIVAEEIIRGEREDIF